MTVIHTTCSQQIINPEISLLSNSVENLNITNQSNNQKQLRETLYHQILTNGQDPPLYDSSKFHHPQTSVTYLVTRPKFFDNCDTIFKNQDGTPAFYIPDPFPCRNWNTQLLRGDKNGPPAINIDKISGIVNINFSNSINSNIRTVCTTSGVTTTKREFEGFDGVKYRWKNKRIKYLELKSYSNTNDDALKNCSKRQEKKNVKKEVIANFELNKSGIDSKLVIYEKGFHMIDLIAASVFIAAGFHPFQVNH
ncbi:hypothetical protein HDU92_006794 [Lobulomyces angularis]|nr:hypothetical protein HDU92_006794 [Lobulomyces angularis]